LKPDLQEFRIEMEQKVYDTFKRSVGLKTAAARAPLQYELLFVHFLPAKASTNFANSTVETGIYIEVYHCDMI
jgi:hypothetical protein